MEFLMRTADFISIHVRSTPETENLVSKNMISLMKPTAYIINTSRPSIVDTHALVEALQNKRIAGAAIDVFDFEPPGKDDPLVQLDNVTITPHMPAGRGRHFIFRQTKWWSKWLRLWQPNQIPKNIVNASVYEEYMQDRHSFF